MYNDYNAESTCDDGPSMTYLIKMPQVVSDTLAYASAASLGNGANVCGKCFALKFKGRGKYETKENYQKLAEKSLIVMSSNRGLAGGFNSNIVKDSLVLLKNNKENYYLTVKNKLDGKEMFI